MRIAVLGAAAAAFVGGTLAVTPLTTVSAPLPAGATCHGAGGSGCEKLAAVLMPEAPKPIAQHAEAPPFSEAANVIAPPPAPEPGVPSAAGEVPTGGAGGLVGGGGGGGAPVVGGASMPAGGLGGIPDVGLGGIPDPYALAPVLPGLAGLGGLAAVPNSAAVAISVAQGVVGVGGSLVGIGTGVVGTVESAAIAVVFLKNAGLLPSNIGLPSVSLPSVGSLGVPGIGTPSQTAAAAALPAVATIPGAAAALPAVGLPAVGLPAAPALPTLPAAGLPAAPPLPALPALPALPPAGLPAPPPLPGPPALPHPRFCTPSIGPIGACTP